MGTIYTVPILFPKRLTLGELELLTSFRTAWLLTLNRTCITREKTEVTQLDAVSFIFANESACNCEAKRTSLTALATTAQVCLNIVTAECIGDCEWLLNRADVVWTWEVITQCASINVPLAGARLQINSANRFLTTTYC